MLHLNEISVNDIRQKLEIEGNFDDSLIVVGDVYVAQELRAEKLNGRKTKDLYDLLLRNEKLQLLNRDIIFDDLNIYGSVKTSDLTAGNATILKRKAAFALRALEKNFISEYMIWDSIETESVNVMGLVNKFKLYDLVEDSVFASDPSTVFVKGPKYFLNGFHVDGDLESDSINGIDLRRNLFSRTEFQVIYDNAHFEHLNHQNVFIESFNGIDISRFNYAQKREKIVINEPLTFKGFVHVSSLKLGQGYLGGINAKRVLDDAVDLRAGKIIISGKKTFVQPPTFTNLNVVRLNNELLPKLNKNFNDMVFDYIVVNGTLMVTKMKTKNLVTKNQKSLLSPSHLRSEFLLTDKVLNPLIFEDLIVYGNISTSRVNGYILEDDFLTKTTNQSLWSRFNISSMLTRDVFVDGLVNGFKIPDGSIIQESTKVISASVVQNGSLHIPGSLFVKGQFGDRKIKISDLIILTEDSHFNGLLSFHSPLVTTFIKAVDEDSTLNGMTLLTLDARLRSFRQLLSLQNISKPVNSSNPFLEAMKNTWSSECLKTKMLQHSLSEAFIEPHSFVLSSVQQFETPNATRFFDQPMKSNEKPAPVLIFKVFLLAVGSSEGKCENKGSSLWSFDLNTLKMERIQELKSAVNAIAIKIDRTSYVYWNYGHHNSLMSFSDGRLELTRPDGNPLPEIKLCKVFMKPGGGRLIISYFDDILDIVDDNERRAIFLPNVVGIEIVRTTHNEIIFLVSKLKFGLTGESHLLEAYLYERMNLFFISSLPLESSSLILNLETPKYDYDHAMIFALSANHPRILTLGGFPFIKTWRDFPSKLKNSLWAYDFIDSDNNFYLCYGDQSQIYTIRLERQGVKYYGPVWLL
ncbi:hypothetical protein Anas_06515 [Armadillidium nasatum]|uniref:Uncharacterized protein n=1 Tax=Armadillidium nasatum TaxID=96803 RepID=A0A5N5ST44_9CRUS|nr:hypothetical protein Anas_06515 [Armadillidium nasatum]